MSDCPPWCARPHGADDQEPEDHETFLTPHDALVSVTLYQGPHGRGLLFNIEGNPIRGLSCWPLICTRDDMERARARLAQILDDEAARDTRR